MCFFYLCLCCAFEDTGLQNGSASSFPPPVHYPLMYFDNGFKAENIDQLFIAIAATHFDEGKPTEFTPNIKTN